MRVPQVPAMAGMTPLGLKLPPKASDEKIVAERRWQAGLRPNKPQLPADHGLFSDEASQLDLVEMFQEPTNEE